MSVLQHLRRVHQRLEAIVAKYTACYPSIVGKADTKPYPKRSPMNAIQKAILASTGDSYPDFDRVDARFFGHLEVGNVYDIEDDTTGPHEFINWVDIDGNTTFSDDPEVVYLKFHPVNDSRGPRSEWMAYWDELDNQYVFGTSAQPLNVRESAENYQP